MDMSPGMKCAVGAGVCLGGVAGAGLAVTYGPSLVGSAVSLVVKGKFFQWGITVAVNGYVAPYFSAIGKAVGGAAGGGGVVGGKKVKDYIVEKAGDYQNRNITTMDLKDNPDDQDTVLVSNGPRLWQDDSKEAVELRKAVEAEAREPTLKETDLDDMLYDEGDDCRVASQAASDSVEAVAPEWQEASEDVRDEETFEMIESMSSELQDEQQAVGDQFSNTEASNTEASNIEGDNPVEATGDAQSNSTVGSVCNSVLGSLGQWFSNGTNIRYLF